MKIIIDFDGTLTAEETQVETLAAKSLDTLASEILGVPRSQLAADYEQTRQDLLRSPHLYAWEVNGLIASYCDEGAFILNTTTLQHLLRNNDSYCRAVRQRFARPEYDAIADCTNHLFHRHSAEVPHLFRPSARAVLTQLIADSRYQPVILTNSLGDKVHRQLGQLGLSDAIEILGDTRQYDMRPDWAHRFHHPEQGEIQVWRLSNQHSIDLRRPAYYEALARAQTQNGRVVVVADTFSLPGALPLFMGIPFVLTLAPYTPRWCIEAVEAHPLGHVLPDLADLPSLLESILEQASRDAM